MELPYVSVIIPVLNGEKFVNRCLGSIITLDYPKDNHEIIIVDNGSEDSTIEMIKAFQRENPNIKMYKEKIKSSYAARNLGIKNAKGSIIAFTDIDCRVEKEWLINLVRGFSENSIGCVAGEIIPDNGDSIVERHSAKIGLLSQRKVLMAKYLPLPYAQTANVAFRKTLFDQIGTFDDSFISGGDVDFSWRMLLQTQYDISYINDAIVYHKHRTNFKDFYRQAFKYGYGRIFLCKKHENLFNNRIKDDLIRVKGINKGQVTDEDSDKSLILLIFEPLLKITYLCGSNLGKIYGRFVLSKSSK